MEIQQTCITADKKWKRGIRTSRSRTGADPMYKELVSNPKLIRIISYALLNAEAGIYLLYISEWFNGTRSNLVPIPPTIDNDHHPIIIEFQRVVNSHFMIRAFNFCFYVTEKWRYLNLLHIIQCADSIDYSSHILRKLHEYMNIENHTIGSLFSACAECVQEIFNTANNVAYMNNSHPRQEPNFSAYFSSPRIPVINN